MKRGVSSIIATVLLIAFGVILAIFIMGWGTDFIRSSQENVEEQTSEQFSCTTDVAFEVNCECTELGGSLDQCKFTITNNEDSIIKKVTYRLFRGDTFYLSSPEEIVVDLDPWDVTTLITITEDVSAIPIDNVKLEVVATQIETGAKIIDCGVLASNTGNCVII